MKTFCRCHVLVLLGLLIDLINPALPGVFSLSHGDLYMDGVTRAYGSVGGATSVRDVPRERIAPAIPRLVTVRMAHAVRDARRTHERPDVRGAVAATAPHGSADTEDH